LRLWGAKILKLDMVPKLTISLVSIKAFYRQFFSPGTFFVGQKKNPAQPDDTSLIQAIGIAPIRGGSAFLSST